jgi:hypothetical protein
VQVENTCLLKPPVMTMSGLPPLFQIDCSTLFRFASVKARWVPSVRLPVPSAADGSAPEAPKTTTEFSAARRSISLDASPNGDDRYPNCPELTPHHQIRLVLHAY